MIESRSYKHATRQPRQPSEATQQPTVVKASQGYHWKALARFYKQVDCRFSILVLKEVWRRQVKWAVSPCLKHRQNGRHLCNNKPSNESLEGCNRKRLSLQAGVLSLLYLFTGSSFMGSIEKRQFRHQSHECALHNNKPTVQQSKGTIRKLLLRIIIGWIVVLVVFILKEDNQQ